MIQEIIVFTTAALIWGGIMYLYFEWQELRGKGVNAKLKRKIFDNDIHKEASTSLVLNPLSGTKYASRDEVMKELDNGIGEPYSKDLESAAERYNNQIKCKSLAGLSGEEKVQAWNNLNDLDKKGYCSETLPQIKCYCGHTTTCDCEPLPETKQMDIADAVDTVEKYMEDYGDITDEKYQIANDTCIAWIKAELHDKNVSTEELKQK